MSDWKMVIHLADLHAACAKLLMHLEAQGLAEVELDVDYYWSIVPEQRYDPSRQPTELVIGQLSDDWMEIQRIVKSERAPLGYALVWLGAVLRALGERYVA
jgi:hypothetical protein